MSTKREWLSILFLIILFVLIRSIHFAEFLNFSMDQGLFSIKALELYRNKEISLIGPPISFHLNGREVSQGGVIYYFLLLFLILGNFDPIKASYVFMLFSGLMVIPLFFGVKWLSGQKAALLLTIVYVLLPYYIDFTRFLWNVTFQLSLIPVLIFLMGWYKKSPAFKKLLLIGLWSGIVLQFHYQFIVPLLGMFFYYLFNLKRKLSIVGFLIGIIIGFGPLIIFELRNNFYNLRTVLFYLQNWQDFTAENFKGGSGAIQSHYLLTVSMFVLFLLVGFLKRFISYKFIWVIGMALLSYSLYLYTPTPANGYGMSPDWNYLQERKVNQIIISQNITSYSVTNLIYDTLAQVQRYLLLKGGVKEDFDGYGKNDYLYVISENKDFSENPSYEIQAMRPFGIKGSWVINSRYNLFLINRLK